jgi:AcrR family transcriptional regulator
MTQERSPEAQRLLELTADYLLAHGIAAVSLSALAKGIGSNNRMLLYYFGSKDRLFTEAMRLAFRRYPLMSGVLPLLATDGDLRELVKEGWRMLRAAEHRAYITLFFEAYALVMREPDQNPAHLAELLTDWPDQLVHAFSVHGYDDATGERTALQLLALWRGLQMALLTTIGTEALDDAHDDAVDRLFAGLASS